MKNFKLRTMKWLILPGIILFSGCLIGFAKQPVGNKGIQSAFDPKSAKWDIAWPGRVSQYDLVYKSPPIDPMQGIPLGNGDVGALVWCEDSKIILVVNKCDL
ncbi:MAG: hypothetical protein AAB347_02650, partial [Bacteroidota bacterium]